MKFLKEIWGTFKKPLLVVASFGVIFFMIGTVIPAVRDFIVNQSPIVGIEASNKHEYTKNQTIKPSDFDIFAKHENGKTTKISDENVKLSVTKPNIVGPITEVTLTKNKWSCNVDVKNKRKKIVEFECGKPNKSDVKASVYSNGELAFTGKGDILVYANNDYPWLSYEGQDKYPITSVTFEEEVKPIYMDGYFRGLQELTYIEYIPDTVESMEEICYECVALKEAPDLSNCVNLANMTSAFEKCSSLEKAPKIPASVKVLDKSFADCIELKEGADMSDATGVIKAEGLYYGCNTMNKGELPPNIKNITSAYENCINIKQMPYIPETVEIMESAFRGASSMVVATEIPASVKDVAKCFDGCSKLKGILVINGNPTSYSGFLTNAASAANIDLQGSSVMLDILARESNDNPNVTVNGKMPNYDISYSDMDF